MSILNSKPIPATLLAKNNPLDVSQGFAIYPIDGKNVLVPAGISVQQQLLSFNSSRRLFSFSASLGYSLFVGAAGPGWSTKLQPQGVYGLLDSNQQPAIFMTGSTQDELAAGLYFGMAAGLNFSITGSAWVYSLNIGGSITFDLIAVIFEIISLALNTDIKWQKILDNVLSSFPAITATYGFFGDTQDSYLNTGTLTAPALFNMPINIWPLLVLLDETTAVFGEVLTSSNAVLNATLSSLGFGLLIGIGVDVNVSITSWTLDQVVYSSLAFGNGTCTGLADVSPNNPTQLGVVFDEVPTFDFQVGFYASLTLFSLFSIGVSIETDTAQGLHLNDIQPFHFKQTLSAPLGSTVAERQPLRVEFA